METNATAFRQVFRELIKDDPTILQIKDDLSILQEDVAMLKEDVAMLKEDVKNLKELVLHQGVMAEETNHNIKLILEVIVPAKKRSEHMDKLLWTADHHDSRLSAVEIAVKNHIQNRSLHRH